MTSDNSSKIDLDNQLYEIGLLPVSLRSDAKPRYLNHPVVVFLINVIYLIMKLSVILTDNKNTTMLIALGDFTHTFSAKNIFNMVLLLEDLMFINFQLIYYYNHKRCI